MLNLTLYLKKKNLSSVQFTVQSITIMCNSTQNLAYFLPFTCISSGKTSKIVLSQNKDFLRCQDSGLTLDTPELYNLKQSCFFQYLRKLGYFASKNTANTENETLSRIHDKKRTIAAVDNRSCQV